MSQDPKSAPPTPEPAPTATPTSATTRGSVLHKGGFQGVVLSPQQQLPNAVQAMTPVSPPTDVAPSAPIPAPAPPAVEGSTE